MRNLITGIWETLFGNVMGEAHENCHELLLQRIHECNALQQQIIKLKKANADLISKLQEQTERCELALKHFETTRQKAVFYHDSLWDVRGRIVEIYDALVEANHKKFPTDDATPPASTN